MFGDYFITATATDQNGDFQFCLTNDSANPVDLYVVILTCSDPTHEGDACGSLSGTPTDYPVVVTTNTDVLYLTHTYDLPAEDICIGTVHWDIIDRRGQYNGAQHIYNLLANDAYDYLAHSVGWYNTHNLTVYFPDVSTGFEIPNEILHVASGDEQDPDILLNTYGYFVLYHLYGGLFPAHTWGCPGHGWGGESDPGCAWIHGWAYFLQAAIQDDPIFLDTPAPGEPPNVEIDMEVPDPAVSGLDDDGAVAATLWDILDTAAESWDELTHSLSEIWTVVEPQPNDLCELSYDFQELYGPGTSLDDILAHHEVGCITVVDPNPDLMAEGDVVDSPAALASGGRPIVGLAADGVTRVLVRRGLPEAGTAEFRILDENGLATGVGTLRAPAGGEGDTTLAVATQEWAEGRHMAFAVLVAPQDFVREPADDDLAERPLNIHMTFTPSGGGAETTAARQIALVRPPVMLLHGLWSAADTWDWPLETDSRFTVYAEDYWYYHADKFRSNIDWPRLGVDRVVNMMRGRGIAATQADVIGHSMGGLLSRLYVAENSGDYRRDDNFGEGDIHKLITLDTPHFGSPLADVLVAISETPVVGPIFNRVMRSTSHCVDCGAVADLRPGSDVLLTLPSAEVPAHAIVGRGGSDILQAGVESMLPIEMAALLAILRAFGVLPEDLFPPERQHDFIVGRISQEGGLGTGSGWTSVFRLSVAPPALAIHTTVTTETRVGDRVIELLNMPTDDDTVFASAFPPRSSGETTEPLCDLVEHNWTAGSGIQITSPVPGTPVAPGAEVLVSVESSGGFVPVRVLVVSNNDAKIDEEPPFQVEIEVPSSAIGEICLSAVAFDADDNLAESKKVVVPVNVPAVLTGISVVPETLYLFAYAPAQAVRVVGSYDDGVERDLTPGVLGTTYETSDAQVATIDSDGVVTAHRLGSTVITAANGAHMAVANVIVVSALADFDRDHNADLDDFAAFTTCFSGPANAPGFVMRGTACRDFFDGDGDQDIDLTDFASFQRAFTGPVP